MHYVSEFELVSGERASVGLRTGNPDLPVQGESVVKKHLSFLRRKAAGAPKFLFYFLDLLKAI